MHTVTLGRLSLTIPPRVGKHEEELCVAATPDTLPRFITVSQGNCSVSWCAPEGYRNGRSASKPMDSEESRCCCCSMMKVAAPCGKVNPRTVSELATLCLPAIAHCLLHYVPLREKQEHLCSSAAKRNQLLISFPVWKI